MRISPEAFHRQPVWKCWGHPLNAASQGGSRGKWQIHALELRSDFGPVPLAGAKSIPNLLDLLYGYEKKVISVA
jgi:hypothetical protein